MMTKKMPTALEQYGTGEVKNGKKVLVRELSREQFNEWYYNEALGWTIIETTDTYVEFSTDDIDFMYRIYL